MQTSDRVHWSAWLQVFPSITVFLRTNNPQFDHRLRDSDRPNACSLDATDAACEEVRPSLHLSHRLFVGQIVPFSNVH